MFASELLRTDMDPGYDPSVSIREPQSYLPELFEAQGTSTHSPVPSVRLDWTYNCESLDSDSEPSSSPSTDPTFNFDFAGVSCFQLPGRYMLILVLSRSKQSELQCMRELRSRHTSRLPHALVLGQSLHTP